MSPPTPRKIKKEEKRTRPIKNPENKTPLPTQAAPLGSPQDISSLDFTFPYYYDPEEKYKNQKYFALPPTWSLHDYLLYVLINFPALPYK